VHADAHSRFAKREGDHAADTSAGSSDEGYATV
jgi:hypothetical protein